MVASVVVSATLLLAASATVAQVPGRVVRPREMGFDAIHSRTTLDVRHADLSKISGFASCNPSIFGTLCALQ